ncbi:hypothetical protein [Pseudomonas sp. NPDC087804]|uniref:hypothetical protein n=1 Tax=Pseudomonas sp. NPDC087804 TaxID=3364449 RepID=UPI0038085DA7
MLTIITNWLSDSKNWGTLLVTAPIAIIALIVAIKNYKRKSGIAINGGIGIASSSRCEENYVSHIVLENLKDRAVTIYGIFLKVGHNFYIEIEDHDDTPFILKPYETYHKKMGEILFYSVNMNKIKMDKLLRNDKVKKRIVLSTSEGKYTVPKEVKRWSPVGEFFNNYLTGVIRTNRTSHNGKDVGGNVRFIVDIKNKEGRTESIHLMPDDYQLVIFDKFNLSRECLLSKESLEIFLEEKRASNLISETSTITVYDFQDFVKEVSRHYSNKSLEAKMWSAFYYYVFGRLYTLHSNLKTKITNRRNQKNYKKRKP